jgi:cytidylate kinase
MQERFDFRSIFKPRERREIVEAEPTLYLPDFDVLTISGYAGTGKTSAADDLNRRIIGTHFIKVGQKVRAENADITNVEAAKDVNIDLEQERLMLRTLNSSPLILESRFGAVIGADIVRKFKDKGPRIVKVLTIAEESVRHQRLVKRTQAEDPTLTPDEIVRHEIERDRKFVSRMNALYPYLLEGQHPFDPNLKAANGQKVYDVILDTTDIAKGKVIDELIRTLEQNGYISKLGRDQFGEGEVGNNAYELIKNGALCESEGCQKLAKQTLDSASKRSIHSFAVCSDSHFEEMRTQVCGWAGEAGVELKFGKNGQFEEKEIS